MIQPNGDSIPAPLVVLIPLTVGEVIQPWIGLITLTLVCLNPLNSRGSDSTIIPGVDHAKVSSLNPLNSRGSDSTLTKK